MDWNRVEGNWKQLRGGVKEKWGKLTDDDLTAISGRRDELEGKIQERYGYTKDRVRKEIDDWRRSVESDVGSGDTTAALESIRADLESLASTVSRIAGDQLGRVQDKAIAKANQAEDAIRQNPLTAIGIAFGFGFLYGVMTRR
jgi:uncharacterized protein YjbJ (UPF0337 family)/ElaB/YqjD/DUF883 family membrane-anchored ribosome-binding protein